MANRIEQLQQNFLLDELGDEPKFHLVNWAIVCDPLPSGGLAIRILRHFNEALLGKWLWRLGLERDALWRRVKEVKYGCEWGGGEKRGGVGCSNSVSAPYGVSLWKYIRRGHLLCQVIFSLSSGMDQE